MDNYLSLVFLAAGLILFAINKAIYRKQIETDWYHALELEKWCAFVDFLIVSCAVMAIVTLFV